MVGFLYMALSSPFIVAILFVFTLALASLVVGCVDSFLGFVVFVVYVGGALVLFSYCFMLTPIQDTSTPMPTAAFPMLLLSLSSPLVSHTALYEFYWVSSLLVSVGVLLFIVMLCVVSMVDFSQGAMRVL
uniref:NADH dehydrogenase subunit 6 n=1 Tax=Parasagitta elegans TaxID=1562708 RepID=A0A141CLS1_9BILA|nr:NADH dehydrogenase subunit 6 [Parasagitta elegans]